MKKSIAAAVAASVLVLSGCGVSTTPSTTKLQVGAGPFEDPKYKDCVPSGTKRNSPTNDDYYSYPLSERDLDLLGEEGSDGAAITVVSKDNVQMAIPIRFAFNMVSDCKTLQQWHTSYGERYSAYLDDDGTSTKGWLTVLKKIMGAPMDTRLDEIAKKHDWLDLYNDAQAQNELESEVLDNIEKVVDQTADGHYFEDFIITMKKPVPTDQELLSTINQAQKDYAAAEAKIRQAEADKAQAQAEVKVAEAQARKKAAEIRGFGSFENYLKFVMVQEGLNPEQPSYVWGGNAPQ